MPTAEKITIACPLCGKSLSFAATSLGRRAQCPSCDGTVMLEVAKPAPPKGRGGLLKGLRRGAAALATAAPERIKTIECPGCGGRMSRDQVPRANWPQAVAAIAIFLGGIGGAVSTGHGAYLLVTIAAFYLAVGSQRCWLCDDCGHWINRG